MASTGTVAPTTTLETAPTEALEQLAAKVVRVAVEVAVPTGAAVPEEPSS